LKATKANLRFQLEALEPRVLLSGDGLLTSTNCSAGESVETEIVEGMDKASEPGSGGDELFADMEAEALAPATEALSPADNFEPVVTPNAVHPEEQSVLPRSARETSGVLVDQDFQPQLAANPPPQDPTLFIRSLALSLQQDADIVWTGAGDGESWSDADNWDLERTPIAEDDVLIDVADADFTVIVRGAIAVNSLTNRENLVFESGSLVLAEASTTTGFDWQSGFITALGSITNLGSFTISGTSIRDFNGIFVNEGIVLDSATGSIRFRGETTRIENRAGGVYQKEAGVMQLLQASAIRFINQGTYRQIGEQTVQFGIPFELHEGALIDVQGGRLNLSGGSENTGGEYRIAAGALLDLQATGHSFTGRYTGAGEGELRISTNLRAQ